MSSKVFIFLSSNCTFFQHNSELNFKTATSGETCQEDRAQKHFSFQFQSDRCAVSELFRSLVASPHSSTVQTAFFRCDVDSLRQNENGISRAKRVHQRFPSRCIGRRGCLAFLHDEGMAKSNVESKRRRKKKPR